MEKQYREDLEYFLEQAQNKHLDFYFLHSDEEMNRYIDNYLSNNTIKNKYAFLYFMKSLIKYMSGVHDAHTAIYDTKSIKLPIKIKCIEDNVFIDKCIDHNFQKSKIISINGIDISVIKKELEPTISYGTNSWLKAKIEGDLTNVSNLLMLPSINPDSNKIVIETTKGNLDFSCYDEVKRNVAINQKSENNISIKNNILVYKYPKCHEYYKPNLEEIQNIINSFSIEGFILDLRGNSGGNSQIIEPLIDYLATTDLKLTALVDRHVFSSGRFAVVEMQKIGSKVVGEDIGTPINCFGYIAPGGETPNTNFTFNFAKRYWYKDKNINLMRSIHTKDELQAMPKNFFEPQYIELDKHIELTEEEYLTTNEDIVLEKTYQYMTEELEKVKWI